MRLTLKTFNGSYVCAEGGGGGPVAADRKLAGDWEHFRVVRAPTLPLAATDLSQETWDPSAGEGDGLLMSGDRICLQSFKGHFLSAVDATSPLVAPAAVAGETERFEIVRWGVAGPIRYGDYFNLKASNHKFVTAAAGGGGPLVAALDSIDPSGSAGTWATFRWFEDGHAPPGIHSVNFAMPPLTGGKLDNPEIFAVDYDTGALMRATLNAGPQDGGYSWTDAGFPGGTALSSVRHCLAVVEGLDPNRKPFGAAFAIDSGGGIHASARGPAVGSWGVWTALNNSFQARMIDAAALATPGAELHAIDRNGTLWHGTYAVNGTCVWEGTNQWIGVPLQDLVAVTPNRACVLDVNGRVFEYMHRPVPAWTPLAASVQMLRLACHGAPDKDGLVWVYAVGRDRQLYCYDPHPPVRSWHCLGGNVLSAAGAILWGGESGVFGAGGSGSYTYRAGGSFIPVARSDLNLSLCATTGWGKGAVNFLAGTAADMMLWFAILPSGASVPNWGSWYRVPKHPDNGPAYLPGNGSVTITLRRTNPGPAPGPGQYARYSAQTTNEALGAGFPHTPGVASVTYVNDPYVADSDKGFVRVIHPAWPLGDADVVTQCAATFDIGAGPGESVTPATLGWSNTAYQGNWYAEFMGPADQAPLVLRISTAIAYSGS